MRRTYRSTQRAPLSCTSCASRKVKCSREIPCQACIGRGAAAECKREVVIVRGRIRTADVAAASPSNADLLLENSRLAALISASDEPDDIEVPATDLTEYYEKRLYAAVGKCQQPRTVSSLGDIAVPSESCSQFFVDYAEIWTSWVHFAFFFPYFRSEHTRFWSDGGSLSSQDPLWMAVYFGVLSSNLIFMNDEEFESSNPPLDSRDVLLRNWYDAALYFLDLGDFMQRLDILSVRAIAILGIIATTVGDTNRHANLWSCGIRIAQQLGLGSEKANIEEDVIQREARRRLWWTLVVCEWIPIPIRMPCINNVDFDCQLPADIDDSQLQGMVNGKFSTSRPVQYHIVMSKIALIYYQLHAKIRLRRWSPSEMAEFVFYADDQLAALIEQLPSHLQNDEPETFLTRERDRQQPWIRNQKTSLAMIILYYRLAINRILQCYWLEGSTHYARSRAVSLSSAMGVLTSVFSESTDFRRLRSW